MFTARLRAVSVIATLAICGTLLSFAFVVHAQTTSTNQLRATITAEIMADPRSKDLSQAQIYSLVNALSAQAQKQNLTTSQLTYRPGITPGSALAFGACNDISCSLSDAFGLDGSLPIIPIALFVMAVLFILIYGIMREMGHPHAKA